MIHFNLRIEVQGSYILVAMRGTCFRAKYRKQDAPWLAMDEYVEDPEASQPSRSSEASLGKPQTRRLAT